MAMWVLDRGGDVAELAGQPATGDRVLRRNDDGYEVGVVREAEEPYIEWHGQVDASVVGHHEGRGPHRVDDLPEVEALVQGASGAGRSGRSGQEPPPPA